MLEHLQGPLEVIILDANLRGVKLKAGALKQIKGFRSESASSVAAGPALVELDSVFKKASQVNISFRVGKHLRYRWEDVDTWLAEQGRTGGAA